MSSGAGSSALTAGDKQAGANMTRAGAPRMLGGDGPLERHRRRLSQRCWRLTAFILAALSYGMALASRHIRAASISARRLNKTRGWGADKWQCGLFTRETVGANTSPPTAYGALPLGGGRRTAALRAYRYCKPLQQRY